MFKNKVKKELLPREVYVLSVVAFFVAVGYGLIIPGIPLFAKSFGVNNTAIGLIISSFAFVRFTAGSFTGQLVDRFGERNILGIGLFIVAISAFVSGFSQTYWQLLIFRALGGLGSSMFSVAAGALLMRSVPDNFLGRAQSTYNGGFLIGGMTGPAFGGLLSAISLRAPFFVYGITLSIASAVGFIFLTEKRLGKSITNKIASADRIAIKDALKIFPYQTALVLSFMSGFMLIGMRNSILPTFAKNSLNTSTSWIGYAYTVGAIAQAIALIYTGRLSDFRGRRFVLISGTSLILAAIFALIFATNDGYLFGSMILFGLGGALMTTGNSNVVGDLFSGKGGQLVATFQMAGDFGAIISPIALGWIADQYSPHAAFITCAIVFSIAVALAVKLPETRRLS